MKYPEDLLGMSNPHLFEDGHSTRNILPEHCFESLVRTANLLFVCSNSQEIAGSVSGNFMGIKNHRRLKTLIFGISLHW